MKKSNFGKFLEENGIKPLLKPLKIGLMIANIVVQVSSFQQNAQHLKSVHFWRNMKHFCETCKSSENRQNFMDAVHSQGHSRKTDGPKRVLGLVFLLPGNPNAAQQVNFYIQDLAHNS